MLVIIIDKEEIYLGMEDVVGQEVLCSIETYKAFNYLVTGEELILAGADERSFKRKHSYSFPVINCTLVEDSADEEFLERENLYKSL